MGIEGMSDREALTRLMADLGGLGDAESRLDEDENLYPYRPEAERAAPVEYEYGWAPHALSRDKLPTEAEAREAYSMAVGQPVRRWKRERRELPQWVPADEEN